MAVFTRTSRVATALVVVVLGSTIPAVAHASDGPLVTVSVEPGMGGPAVATRAVRALGGEVVAELPVTLGALVARVPAGRLGALERQVGPVHPLGAVPLAAETAEQPPDTPAPADPDGPDPGAGAQAPAVARAQATAVPRPGPSLAALATGDDVSSSGFDGSGTTVAIVDSGIDYTHADLGGPGDAATAALCRRDAAVLAGPCAALVGPDSPLVQVGLDLVGDRWPSGPETVDPNPIDLRGHGTHVAAVVHALAPGARLHVYKACSSTTGTCSTAAVLAAIERAVDPDGDGDPSDRVDVLNLSLGTGRASLDDPLVRAVERASSLGVVVVAAAGNDRGGPFAVASPAVAPSAIAVAEVDGEGRVTDGSARGPGPDGAIKPDLAAPSGFWSAVAGSGDGRARFAGTSAAAPVVTAVAALVRQLDPFLPASVVKARVVAAAEPLAGVPVSRAGAGVVRPGPAVWPSVFALAADGQVGLGFGLVDVAGTSRLVRSLVVVNHTGESRTVTMAARTRTGPGAPSAAAASWQVPGPFVLGPFASRTVQVALTLDGRQLPAWELAGLAGFRGSEPGLLDGATVDGWIAVADGVAPAATVPWSVVARRAAAVQVDAGGAGGTRFVNVSPVAAGDVDLFPLAVARAGAGPGGSAVATLAAVGARRLDGGVVQFAVATRGRWLAPSSAPVVAVEVDRDGDGRFDAVVRTAAMDDGRVAVTVEDARGRRTAGYAADTDVGASVVVLSVDAAELGVAPDGPAQLLVRATTFDRAGGAPLDTMTGEVTAVLAPVARVRVPAGGAFTVPAGDGLRLAVARANAGADSMVID